MFLLLLVLFHGSQHATGEEVIADNRAESVLLPCQVDASVSRGATVVWKRSDLQPSTVHIRWQNSGHLSGQNQRFVNRTSMMANALQTGNLSLALKKPTYADSGTYTCVINMGGSLSEREVILYVKEPPPPPPVWPAYVITALSIFLVLLIVAFVVFYRRQKSELKKRYEGQKLRYVKAESGQRSVTLPFRFLEPPNGNRVEWRHVRTNRLVFKFENDHEQLGNQHQDYRDRVEVTGNPLISRNFSLTLKNPRYEDGHIYICTVYMDGEIISQKLVRLVFKVEAIKHVKEGVKTVALPFRRQKLRGNYTVEWRRVRSNKLLYKIENGQEQPGDQHQDYKGRVEVNRDFSLTLKYPDWRDKGTYTCNIFKNGNLIKQEAAGLVVSARKIKVKEGMESVSVPFTFPELPDWDAVEWRREMFNELLYKIEKDQDQLGDQHQDYQGRVEVTKNFSLTLRSPRCSDKGPMICTVYKDGVIIKQKAADLVFKASIRRLLAEFFCRSGAAGGPLREEQEMLNIQ